MLRHIRIGNLDFTVGGLDFTVGPPIAALDVDVNAVDPANVEDAIFKFIDEMMELDEKDKTQRPILVDKLASVFDLAGKTKLARELREAKYDLDRVQSIIDRAVLESE